MYLRSRILLRGLVAAALPLATLSAKPANEHRGAPVQLDRVDVTAERTISFTVPSLAEARTELALTPGAIETVDAERFLRGRASTLEDTFALSAGVVAQSRFGSDEARLSIRGSGLQRTFHGRGLRVLQDGVPLNLADGGFDMQAIEPLATAYVNVWRGANALALGSSTLGGAIDYVSRTGRGAPGALARLEFGSWRYLRASVAGGGARGEADGYASFTQQSQDGFRTHAKQNSQRLFANGGLRLSAAAETRFYVTGIRSDSELPGNLRKAQLRAGPGQAAAGNIALDQKRDFDLLRVANKTTVRTGATTWDFTAGWSYKDLDHPIFQVIDQLSNDLLLGAVATHVDQIYERSHRIRVGIHFNRGRTNAANFLNVAGRRGALVSAATQTATNVEAFAEDQLALGRDFTLVLGASAAANRRKNDQTSGATPDYDSNYERVMPKVGVRWDAHDIQLYANVSGSYEPPSFSEALTLGTPRSAQTALTWEAGSRGMRGPVRWDASLYRAALEQELLTIDDDNNPATPAATINAGDTIHEGVEFAAEVDLFGTPLSASDIPAHRLVLRFAWTYGRFTFDEDPRYGGNTLAGLPPHLIRGEFTWEDARGWYAGPTFEWVPRKTFIDFRNTYAADAYAIAGFRLGRRIPKGISWFAEIRNVFDQTYAATTGVIENAAGRDQPQFLPGDGRAFYLGLDHRW